MEKVKTLTPKDDQTTPTSIISFPTEIIQDILSRLSIKPLLRLTSVSKQWLSLISHDPSFRKLHFARSLATNRTARLISVCDSATERRHFLSARLDGGPVTHLLTLDNAPYSDDERLPTTTSTQHLNGLVLFTSNALSRRYSFALSRRYSFAFVINPTTRKVFKLPVPTADTGFVPCIYFFGFHQSRNEHCVLSIRMFLPENTNFRDMPMITVLDAIEFMIYSLSTYSWRKIDVKEEELPIGIIRQQWYDDEISSVCVNSVIHLMFEDPNKILAFDLTTEKFSTIDVPQDAIPHEITTIWFNSSRGRNTHKTNYPYLMDINGCLGLVCHDRVVERNEMYLWILQDYDSRVWVKETLTFSESWINSTVMYPVDYVVDMDMIVFSARSMSWDGETVPIYDMKTKGFKLVQLPLGQQFLCSNTMELGGVRSYVESILPLEKNEEGLHEHDK